MLVLFLIIGICICLCVIKYINSLENREPKIEDIDIDSDTYIDIDASDFM